MQGGEELRNIRWWWCCGVIDRIRYDVVVWGELHHENKG